MKEFIRKLSQKILAQAVILTQKLIQVGAEPLKKMCNFSLYSAVKSIAFYHLSGIERNSLYIPQISQVTCLKFSKISGEKSQRKGQNHSQAGGELEISSLIFTFHLL